MGGINDKPLFPEDDLDFIANHTSVSLEEVTKQYDTFLAKHPGGRISLKNFRMIMKTCFPHLNINTLESQLTIQDDCGCSIIGFKEFMIVVYVLSKDTLEENLIRIFAIFGIDKMLTENGNKVSQKELARIIKFLLQSEIFPDSQEEESDEQFLRIWRYCCTICTVDQTLWLD